MSKQQPPPAPVQDNPTVPQRIALTSTDPSPSASRPNAAVRMPPRSPPSLSPPQIVSYNHSSRSAVSLTFPWREAAAPVPDRLKCTVCREVLFQPVRFIECQHSFCGHCAKQELLKSTKCPTCHVVPLETRRNTSLDGEIATFLHEFPLRERTARQKREISFFYTPGEPLLPPAKVGEGAPRSPRAQPSSLVPGLQRVEASVERAPSLAQISAAAPTPVDATPRIELDGREIQVLFCLLSVQPCSLFPPQLLSTCLFE